MFDMSEFSNRFRQLKDEAKLTLKDLSEALDITSPNLSYYMKGREPSYDILIKIADYFNVTTDWLIGRTDERNKESISTIEMIEKKLSNIPDFTQLTGKSKEYYLQIQSMILDILENVYLIYGAFGESYEPLLHKQFPMMFNAFSRGIQEYIFVLSNAPATTRKDKILEFVQNVDLIADVTHQLTLGSSYLCVACLYLYFDNIPKNDLESLRQIMDFTINCYAEKYPNEKTNEIFEKINNLHTE